MQKLEDEISEKKNQIRALEQQMIESFGMSHTTDSLGMSQVDAEKQESLFYSGLSAYMNPIQKHLSDNIFLCLFDIGFVKAHNATK